MEDNLNRLQNNDETLVKLYISWNNIGDNNISKNGAIAIRDALQYNYSLTKIFGVNVGDLLSKKKTEKCMQDLPT